MAYYFGSGEGRCPSASKTVTVYYTRDKLVELQEKVAKHEAGQKFAIGIASTIMAPEFTKSVKGLLGAISTGTAANALQDYFFSASGKLTTILKKNSGSGFNVKFNLNCINKGRNGHYWVIKSASV